MKNCLSVTCATNFHAPKTSSDITGRTVGKILKTSFKIFPIIVISCENKRILKEDLKEDFYQQVCR